MHSTLTAHPSAGYAEVTYIIRAREPFVNILIVGGAGYIGSHMVQYLRQTTDDTVVVLDNLVKGHRAAVMDATFIEGDFGERALVEELCRAHGITALMHFGADSLVGESVAHPEKYYENNVVKGKRLIDGALAAGVRQVIFSSTAATYGMPDSVPIREDDPTKPINPYGRTKLAFEGLLESYREAYGLQYTCLRYFNTAGADPAGRIGEDHSPESHLICQPALNIDPPSASNFDPPPAVSFGAHCGF
jgi:UDP-glucose 4-epimerase